MSPLYSKRTVRPSGEMAGYRSQSGLSCAVATAAPRRMTARIAAWVRMYRSPFRTRSRLFVDAVPGATASGEGVRGRSIPNERASASGRVQPFVAPGPLVCAHLPWHTVAGPSHGIRAAPVALERGRAVGVARDDHALLRGPRALRRMGGAALLGP